MSQMLSVPSRLLICIAQYYCQGFNKIIELLSANKLVIIQVLQHGNGVSLTTHSPWTFPSWGILTALHSYHPTHLGELVWITCSHKHSIATYVGPMMRARNPISCFSPLRTKQSGSCHLRELDTDRAFLASCTMWFLKT